MHGAWFLEVAQHQLVKNISLFSFFVVTLLVVAQLASYSVICNCSIRISCMTVVLD